ncbi:Transcription factor TAFII-31 [Metarhizium album ARSEF 1941]|uniref:Transcription factor TAFII-31 n=1 Tax=Metarhizium album (strain ARSEF 1941) TaxID=1081103 RepID=A0A0B2WT38_METAS|nr:Transcription factor TAFII-31 [Metarhizium album ARSEF 1941]KHN96754.1 Transcription factor TAFII-31 [Metarhizium album ARSEF 1941]
MASSQPQPNGVTAPANAPQPPPNAQSTTAAPPGAPQPPAQTPGTADPRPRDARLIELLLTSQGVTAYEQRVPLLLLDFAYRHTSSILNDALHLSGDPYVTQAGSKPSAASGASALAAGDAPITANGVKLAIGARLGYQFRGGSSGGGISKDYMQELARERNKVALPRIVPNEWGVRLPSERFVLSGTSWGLKDMWDEADDEDEEEQQQQGGDAMQGIEAPEPEDVGGDGVEGGTVDDVFGDDVDEEMAE